MQYKKMTAMMIGLALMAMAPFASAAGLTQRSLCIFDVAGTSGDIYNMMRDYKAAALNWGVNFKLIAYSDEKVAAADFKSGKCDAVEMTGIRARAFNKYTGTLAAVGAIPNYKTLRKTLAVLASGAPQINKHLVTGPNEVAGIIPMGAAYLFVHDRSVDTVSELAGKTISVMKYDPQEGKMASMVGMTPVPSDISNFAGRFNNGSVDTCFAPIAAYQALELYKGLQPNGGIVDYVLGQLVAEVMIKQDRFPEGFGLKSRQWMFGQFDRAMKVIMNARESVDPKWWIHISESDRVDYDHMMHKARVQMTKEGLYDADMINLLGKIRCSVDPTRSECS